jgi:DNA-binding winged helix-turn-helix (wHTH) protein
MRYRFDQFELDTEQFSLRANSASIHVEPMVFDLLCFLVENAGQVLTREAIIERVWKGRFVSEATVSSCIKSARKALGDSGQNQTYIRTLRGRGFQFTAPVEGSAQEAADPTRFGMGSSPSRKTTRLFCTAPGSGGPYKNALFIVLDKSNILLLFSPRIREGFGKAGDR